MTGVSNAARMDSIYRSQRHIYDFTRKYYLLGRDRLIAGLDVPPGGTVLEIGCGTGRNLALAARAWPQARLFGLDISTEMLRSASETIVSAGLAGRIRLSHGDATAFDAAALFGQERFDRIYISYSLSMIPDWRAAIDAAAAHLAPGGALHVVDFGQQERLPGGWRALLFAWLKRFDVTPRPDLYSALTRAALAYGGGTTFKRLYAGYAWAGTLSLPPATSGFG